MHHEDHRTETYYRNKVTDEAFLHRLPNLEADYYRYLEIAMNMILPVAALALTLGAMSIQSSYTNIGVTGALALVLAASAITLFYNARVLYVGYFMKKADVMLLIKDKLQKQSEG